MAQRISSWFGGLRQANEALHPFGLGLVPDLSIGCRPQVILLSKYAFSLPPRYLREVERVDANKHSPPPQVLTALVPNERLD